MLRCDRTCNLIHSSAALSQYISPQIPRMSPQRDGSVGDGWWRGGRERKRSARESTHDSGGNHVGLCSHARPTNTQRERKRVTKLLFKSALISLGHLSARPCLLLLHMRHQDFLQLVFNAGKKEKEKQTKGKQRFFKVGPAIHHPLRTPPPSQCDFPRL